MLNQIFRENGNFVATCMVNPTKINIFFKLSSFKDVSNFDQFPRDIGVPADETSGWDADF